MLDKEKQLGDFIW